MIGCHPGRRLHWSVVTSVRYSVMSLVGAETGAETRHGRTVYVSRRSLSIAFEIATCMLIASQVSRSHVTRPARTPRCRHEALSRLSSAQRPIGTVCRMIAAQSAKPTGPCFHPITPAFQPRLRACSTQVANKDDAINLPYEFTLHKIETMTIRSADCSPRVVHVVRCDRLANDYLV